MSPTQGEVSFTSAPNPRNHPAIKGIEKSVRGMAFSLLSPRHPLTTAVVSNTHPTDQIATHKVTPKTSPFAGLASRDIASGTIEISPPITQMPVFLLK